MGTFYMAKFEVGQFVSVKPSSPRAKARTGLIVGLNLDKSGVCRSVRIYIRTSHVTIGVPPQMLTALDCPMAVKEGDVLITGRGLKISLKTGYPL